MRLIQFINDRGDRAVAAISGSNGNPFLVRDASSVRELALEAHRRGTTLADAVAAHGLGERVDYDKLLEDKRLLVPLDHPEPSRMLISLTGLTHLGSAKSRDSMHATIAAEDLTDSMKMFKLGLTGGKPAPGSTGVQPEWAYKGDGSWLVAPEQPIERPSFALDGGEEAEIAGLYTIGDQGEVLRVGFAIGNEFSDHVMERQNYLYLAHSKLRQCSFGPELLTGELPPNVEGTVSIERNGAVVWSESFLTGEDNMCHSIANLEHHHFKYPQFRRPGDVHVHFFGASALSTTHGVAVEDGDVFEIHAPSFGRSLRNRLNVDTGDDMAAVIPL